MSYSIYIADDEKNIRDLIRNFLNSDGYEVTAFENGDLLEAAFLKKPADLVILDIMMPGTDGLTICRRLRENTDVPIILLTARDSELDYVQGITDGGDDYLTKPFRPTILLMRVRALLRRVEMGRHAEHVSEAEEIKTGDLVFSAKANQVTCGGREIAFTQMEMKMLTFMMRQPDKAFSRDELLENVWGYDTEVETRVTDETMRRIRRKLTLSGCHVSIRTVWGFGYKLQIEGESE